MDSLFHIQGLSMEEKRIVVLGSSLVSTRSGISHDRAVQLKVKRIMADINEGIPRRRFGMAKFKKDKKGNRYA